MEKQMKIYALESENLTGLGGRMGTEHTTTNWIKYFSSIDFAKKYAEKHYKIWNKEPIKWKKDGKEIISGDLGFVMYIITEIKLEK